MVLDSKALENFRTLSRTVQTWLALAVLLLLDFVFLVVTSLGWQGESAVQPASWKMLLAQENKETFVQWDSPLALGPLPAGRLRIPPDGKLKSLLPDISMSSTVGPVKVLRTSSMNPAVETGHGGEEWLVHDDWNPAQAVATGLLLLEENEKPYIILLDSSGTMAEPQKSGAVASRYRLALQHLAEERRRSTAPWHIFTFSDQLRDLGMWRVGEAAEFLAELPQAQGRTSLLTALTDLRAVLHDPACVIIVTDGEIDQRDQTAVVRIFSQARADGHRLCLLSPDFEPLPDFDFVRDMGLLETAWPRHAVASILPATHVRNRADLAWKNVPSTRSQGAAIPVLFSQEGRPLLYHEWRGGGLQRFHVVGEPAASLDEIRRLLEKLWMKSATIMLEEKFCTVDLHNDSLEPLQVQLGEWQSVPAQTPGTYRFAVPNWTWESLQFQHQRTGPFTLYNLAIMNQLKQPDRMMTLKQARFEPFGQALSDKNWWMLAVLAVMHAAGFVHILNIRRHA